jgi:hypothetical protein
MASDPNNKKTDAKTAFKVSLGLVGALAIAGLGNGVWELLYRPGIGVLGRSASAIAGRMEAAVYTSAALDPTSISSLIVLLLILGLAAAATVASVIAVFIFPKLFKRQFFPPDPHDHQTEQSYLQALDAYEKASNKRRKLRRAALVAAALYVVGFGFLVFSTQSESILVWRTFHQNLDICAPYLDEQQRLQIQAAFRQIKSKPDFEAIKLQLDHVAEQNSLKLEWY